MQAVSDDGLSYREATNQFSVSKSTLHNRISGKVLPGAKSGAPLYLDEEEEGELVRWLEGCTQIGYAKSVKEVCAIVRAIVAKKNNLESVVVSHGWWDWFSQHHPHLMLHTGEGLVYHRLISTN